ncbi:hypothetical protein C8Q76DRAFT_758474 [Earliella scabrosa]|nr:hypothetical protein C8Q76DRAFT_758474 [Earliella scabrosa]
MVATVIVDPSPNVSIGFSSDTFQALQWSVEMATSNFDAILKSSRLRKEVIEALLCTALFGLFTVITAVSGRMLVLKRRTQTSTIVLLAAIVALYASTATYWAILLAQTVRTYNILIDHASNGLGYLNAISPCLKLDGPRSCASWDVLNPLLDDFKRAIDRDQESELYQDCAGTAALVINVVIGDAIVWWRAWVVWRKKRLVAVLAAASVLLTFVTGTVDAVDTCRAGASSSTASSWLSPHAEQSHSDNLTRPPGALFGGSPWGIAAACLTLATNSCATALIAYVAWQHRRDVQSHLGAGSTRTRVTKALYLLVESGAFYCVIWLFVVVYQLLDYFTTEQQYTYALYFAIGGCLIPLIGIYPALIILVCALSKSDGTTYTLFELPTLSFASTSRGTDTPSSIGNEKLAFHKGRETRRSAPPKSSLAFATSIDWDPTVSHASES